MGALKKEFLSLKLSANFKNIFDATTLSIKKANAQKYKEECQKQADAFDSRISALSSTKDNSPKWIASVRSLVKERDALNVDVKKLLKNNAVLNDLFNLCDWYEKDNLHKQYLSAANAFDRRIMTLSDNRENSSKWISSVRSLVKERDVLAVNVKILLEKSNVLNELKSLCLQYEKNNVDAANLSEAISFDKKIDNLKSNESMTMTWITECYTVNDQFKKVRSEVKTLMKNASMLSNLLATANKYKKLIEIDDQIESLNKVYHPGYIALTTRFVKNGDLSYFTKTIKSSDMTLIENISNKINKPEYRSLKNKKMFSDIYEYYLAYRVKMEIESIPGLNKIDSKLATKTECNNILSKLDAILKRHRGMTSKYFTVFEKNIKKKIKSILASMKTKKALIISGITLGALAFVGLVVFLWLSGIMSLISIITVLVASAVIIPVTIKIYDDSGIPALISAILTIAFMAGLFFISPLLLTSYYPMHPASDFLSAIICVVTLIAWLIYAIKLPDDENVILGQIFYFLIIIIGAANLLIIFNNNRTIMPFIYMAFELAAVGFLKACIVDGEDPITTKFMVIVVASFIVLIVIGFSVMGLVKYLLSGALVVGLGVLYGTLCPPDTSKK